MDARERAYGGKSQGPQPVAAGSPAVLGTAAGSLACLFSSGVIAVWKISI